ncbi:MAG: hypothetical protein IJT68_04935 [Lentisphaeria bacterium]|nr:hypothetical protein [Lentisphaeria bacterium]
MTSTIRTRLLLPFCTILFAASGVLLHAAPVKKLPDEPEESSSVVKKLPDEEEKASAEAEKDAKAEEKKPAKTEAEAIREITERLDRMIYPYKPLQRSREPILNRALSDDVVPSWRLIYVKPFDKPQGAEQDEAEATAEDDEEDVKEDFAAITLIPLKSIRLSNALRLSAVGKPEETILQPLFFTKYGIMWRKLQTQYENFTLYLGATEDFHVFASANISVIYTLFRNVRMSGGTDLISLLVDCLDIEDEEYFTNRFALVHLAEFRDASIPALQRAIKRIAASGQPPIQQFLGLTNIASPKALELLNEASDSEDDQIRDAAFTAMIGMPSVYKELKHSYVRMVETREKVWPGFAACDLLGCAKELSPLLDAYYAKPRSVSEFETVARARWLLKDPDLNLVHTRALNEITIASIRGGEIANSPQYRNVQETDATRNARLQVEDEKRIASAKEAILKAPQTDLSVCAGIELAMFTTKDKRVSTQYISRVNRVGIDILRALPRQEMLRYLDAMIRYNNSVPEAEKLSDIRARVGK